LPELAAELVQSRVDVILAEGTPAIQANIAKLQSRCESSYRPEPMRSPRAAGRVWRRRERRAFGLLIGSW
jgi:hypothetical protein